MRRVLPLPVAIQNASLLSCVEASVSAVASSNRETRSASVSPSLNAAMCAFNAASSARGSPEPAVEVDLGEEQGEVLEVLPDDRGLATGDALLVQAGG